MMISPEQLPLDVEQFWKDDARAHEDNCFSKKAPQAALGIRMSDECVFAELNEPGDPWGHTPPARRLELNRRYNDKAEKLVGIRLLSESADPEDAAFPAVKRIGEVFGGTYHFGQETGEWLSGTVSNPSELEALLDQVDQLDLEDFMLPSNWPAEKKRIAQLYGKKPQQLRHVRGPVTLAASIFGVENLIYLYYDAPELFSRFSETIGRVIVDMSRIMDREAGYSEGKAPSGFSFADDDCCLLTPDMYEMFGFPVLKKIFDRFCPDISDMRYQHSDSDMAHLLPLLGKLNLTGCNFGPTVLIDQIRVYMPRTRIDGCLAPFTFMYNDPDAIAAEVRRDLQMIKQDGSRGLNLSTAGSINNGSRLESMRLIMALIQNEGRYL